MINEKIFDTLLPGDLCLVTNNLSFSYCYCIETDNDYNYQTKSGKKIKMIKQTGSFTAGQFPAMFLGDIITLSNLTYGLFLCNSQIIDILPSEIIEVFDLQ